MPRLILRPSLKLRLRPMLRFKLKRRLRLRHKLRQGLNLRLRLNLKLWVKHRFRLNHLQYKFCPQWVQFALASAICWSSGARRWACYSSRAPPPQCVKGKQFFVLWKFKILKILITKNLYTIQLHSSLSIEWGQIRYNFFHKQKSYGRKV